MSKKEDVAAHKKEVAAERKEAAHEAAVQKEEAATQKLEAAAERKEEAAAKKEEAAALKAAKPKFALGDVVTVGGKKGTVVEVGVHDKGWLATCDQQYSVRLEPWTREEVKDVSGNPQVRYRNPENPDEVRDHEADTLGAVPESALERGE